MARVRASDEVWADFRAAAGQQPLSEVLGELVERHVDRYRSRRLREGELDDSEMIDALERARQLHSDLQTVVLRLERRLELRPVRQERTETAAEARPDPDRGSSR